jgi:hypothetical protein
MPRNEQMFVETPLGDWLMPFLRASAFFFAQLWCEPPSKRSNMVHFYFSILFAAR